MKDIYDIAGLIIKIKPIYDSFYEDNLIHYQIEKQHEYEITSSLTDHIKPIEADLLKADTNRFFYEIDNQNIIQVKNKLGEVKYQINYDKGCHKQSLLMVEKLNQNPSETEYILISMAFLEIAVRRGFICLHASALLLHEEVTLFSAPSRTGKSTHVSYYMSMFPEASIVNDDKPIIKDGFVYGTPFSGKSKYNLNVKYPLKAIIFLNQGTNDIKEIDEDRKIKLLMKNMLRPEVKEIWDKLIPNINEVLKLDMFEASVEHNVSSIYTTYYGVIKGNNMKIKPGFILKQIGSKVMVIPVEQEALSFNGIMTLNKSGQLLFEALNEKRSPDELVDILCDVYDVTKEQARKDVSDFIIHLKKHNLLV